MQSLKDSIQIINQRFIELDKNLNELYIQFDSVVTINENLNRSQNYFSEIISTQMDWFAIIFALTFGILGFSYWFGLIKYFQNKFKQINSESTSQRQIINNNHSDLKDMIKYDISNLDDKVAGLDKSTREFFNEKLNSISQIIENLSGKIDDSIENNSKQLKELLKIQKAEFDVEKDQLLVKINSTQFDAMRGMFFTTINNNDYFSAFTWGISILRSIVVDKHPVDQTGWIENVKYCIENMEYEKSMDNRFEDLIQKLNDIKQAIEGEENINKIEEFIVNFSQLYYANVKSKKK